ncbi:MAG: hypothetical protein B5766_00950 [Candidatus Lumbricidophila eiseniae]|uniref:HTH lacI-type domain-containing protein n=1 Tax=Candidatus Lumbricidiphila eiseniae TaxID=1969409 RepID=A0A2A6FU82_9MICO|nr:MAG: hypothetical protein B5766_00950 [Candidatus Lumbricidophila eiseniae]
MPRKPTIVEVAARAGVSVASVSRVISGIPTRPATEARVRAASAELGYRPDATGRALKLGPTLQVAFAIDDIGNPVYTEMFQGVEAGLAGSDARLLVASTGHNPSDLVSFVKSLSRGAADALIISPLQSSPELVAALLAAPVPVVVVGDLGDGVPLDTVRTDSQGGVVIAHRFLVTAGYTRIAFVNGPTDTAPGRARFAGILKARDEAGVHGPTIDAGAFTVDAGEAAWAQLEELTGVAQPDAVLAANDLLALGIMRGARNAGRVVPDDLGVVGMDDIHFARISSPSLTSVSLGARVRGQLAAELLRERLERPARPPREELVRPSLVLRESTAHPRSGHKLPENTRG